MERSKVPDQPSTNEVTIEDEDDGGAEDQLTRSLNKGNSQPPGPSQGTGSNGECGAVGTIAPKPVPLGSTVKTEGRHTRNVETTNPRFSTGSQTGARSYGDAIIPITICTPLSFECNPLTMPFARPGINFVAKEKEIMIYLTGCPIGCPVYSVSRDFSSGDHVYDDLMIDDDPPRAIQLITSVSNYAVATDRNYSSTGTNGDDYPRRVPLQNSAHPARPTASTIPIERCAVMDVADRTRMNVDIGSLDENEAGSIEDGDRKNEGMTSVKSEKANDFSTTGNSDLFSQSNSNGN
ncbi:unnamed protein product [Orchesella dallaii]|uniref:Uncharacterized protein n=1 Tax=Orchesella dallaii TaxID=48710 RepID=A0ABP1RZZ3_9HEXA